MRSDCSSKIAVTLLVGLLTATTSGQSSAKRAGPIDPADMLELREFPSRSPLDLSPDGEWLAYTLDTQAHKSIATTAQNALWSARGVPIDASRSSAWVTRVSTGESRSLAPAGAYSWGVSWSPNSRSLAYYSDEDGETALWVWDRETSRKQRVLHRAVRPFFHFELPQWTTDSQRLIVKALPEGMRLDGEPAAQPAAPALTVTSDPARSSVTLLGEESPSTKGGVDPAAGRARYIGDLIEVDIATGKSRTLVKSVAAVNVLISPDAKHLLSLEYDGPESPGSFSLLFRLRLVRLSDGVERIVASDVRLTYGRTASWSPDGRSFAVVTSAYYQSTERPVGEVFLIDIDGKRTDLTAASHPNFGANYYDPPVWSPDGRQLYLLGDRQLWLVPVAGGRARKLTNFSQYVVNGVIASLGQPRTWTPAGDTAVYVSLRNRDTRQAAVARIGPSGTADVVFEAPITLGSPSMMMDASLKNQRLVYVAEAGNSPPDAWIVEGDALRGARKLTSTSPSLTGYAFGGTRLVEWRDDRGNILRGTVLVPPDYQPSRSYPTIVEVYGGSSGSNDVHRFGSGGESGVGNWQLFASRGYVVFVPDIPQRVGTPMRDIADAVLPGIDRLVELGIANPDRLAVTGVSYGGYTVLSLLVQTMRFKAAVIRNAAGGNLFTHYGTISPVTGRPSSIAWAEEGQGLMGGSPWQYRDRYIDNSPYFFLDRVTTPLLIVRGMLDQSTPAVLSDEIFVGLKRLGKPVVYARYARGEHGEHTFDRADSLDYFARVEAWFAKYLGK